MGSRYGDPEIHLDSIGWKLTQVEVQPDENNKSTVVLVSDIEIAEPALAEV